MFGGYVSLSTGTPLRHPTRSETLFFLLASSSVPNISLHPTVLSPLRAARCTAAEHHTRQAHEAVSMVGFDAFLGRVVSLARGLAARAATRPSDAAKC